MTELCILSQASKSGGLYFVDAPEGTGKTFLISLILATIRSRNDTALAIASSEIAVTLLDGGRNCVFSTEIAVEHGNRRKTNMQYHQKIGNGQSTPNM